MAQLEVTMPKMGESITEGTVITWHKKVGDAIEADETLLEIGTDKVDTEVPSPSAGVLQEILVQEGDTVDVGTVIAIISTDAEPDSGGDEPRSEDAESEAVEAEQEEPQAEAVEEPNGDGQEAVAEESEVAEEIQASADEDAEPHLEVRPSSEGGVEVVMPKMGESITEGTILTWFKKEGETVEEDEILLEIATDKVDTEVPSPAAGVVSQILVPEGETVEVGTAIARIGGSAGAAAAAKPEAEAPSAPARPAPSAPEGDGAPSTVTPEAEAAGEITREGSDGKFYSPLVRSIAQKEGLSMSELEQIKGSGREGRVTKSDVMAFVEAKKSGSNAGAPARTATTQAAPKKAPATVSVAAPSAATAEGRVEIIKMDRMRQIIAEHMVRSKATSAHVTSFAEADVTNLVMVRERNKDAFLKREGVKLTYTPFFVQAAVQALHDHPLFNASVEEEQIVIRKDLHIGIAVAIGKRGLVAPVIQNAQEKNLVGLARAAADLADRARNKQLQPDELQGGTFTLTNIGSLGSIMGTPIINQPQVSILATGAIKKRPVVLEDPNLGDVIAIRHMMYLSLSYDHRIIDGAMGASFLQRFVSVLENQDPSEEL